jgi:ArsR family transcriptional regulator
LDELDPAEEIVAYCRGPFCVLADEAVTLLRERGFMASR